MEKFCRRKIKSIESVLTAYDRLGFDAYRDLPGNVLWEEMYRASGEIGG